jgi:hypothetical protein
MQNAGPKNTAEEKAQAGEGRGILGCVALQRARMLLGSMVLQNLPDFR